MPVPLRHRSPEWTRWIPAWGAVVLGVCIAVSGAQQARADDGLWLGATTDWADPSNWTSAPLVPDGTATFNNSGSVTVDSNSLVLIGAIQFTAAPDAQAYTINNNADIFAIYGAGIFNQSTNTQTFNVLGDGMIFLNSATASGGTGAVGVVNSTQLTFQGSSTAGNAAITNNATGFLNWFSASTAAMAALTNSGSATFNDNSTAGTANITNDASGTLTFSNAASAQGATIVNDGSLLFSNSSQAGTATITNNATVVFSDSANAGAASITNTATGALTFSNTSTAQGATIVNDGGVLFSDTARAGIANITNNNTLDFIDAASADHAAITNNAGITFAGTSTADHAVITYGTGWAATLFLDNSTAGNATFQSAPGIAGNYTAFFNSSSAGSATILNTSGFVLFGNTTTAGSANIANTGSFLGPALTVFDQTSTAGSATITNNSDGLTLFEAQSTAGTASIVNNPGGGTLFGVSGGSTASAGQASILNAAGSGGLGTGGFTEFYSSTTAGNATITTQDGGAVAFFETSSGGAARFITEAGGVFDISQLTSAGTTAGSIEGAGTYYLGDRQLTVGGNNLSTIVSGVISDGSCGCYGPAGVGGSLVKVGTGTLALAGANTYTGTTTISDGTLQIGNGGTTGTAGFGAIINNSVLAFNRSNLLTFGNVISGTGAVNQIGSGTTVLTAVNTYTGLTSIFGGQLTIAAGASVASSVTNRAGFANSGSVGGLVTNSGSFTQSAGSVSGGVLNSGTVNANGGALNGSIGNMAGSFNIGGTVTSNSDFINDFGATLTIGAAGNYALAGVLRNVGHVTNTGLFGASVARNDGTIVNSGVWTGNVASSGGALVNNASWIGSINTAGSFTQSAGSVSGGLTNTGTVSAIGGAINGVIANNAGAFNVLGTVTSNSSFSNAAGATLAIAGGANYTLAGLLSNAGAVTVAGNGLLDASAGGLSNLAGGTIAVAAGGTLRDDLANAGTVINSGLYVANVASNTGTITNAGSWTGTVATSGSFTNAAGGSVSGLLSATAGTVVNNGALNGGAQISGGILSGTGSVAGLTVSGGTFAPGSGAAGSSMTIAGNLSLTSGVQYLVVLDSSTSSFANVTGTAALGGATVSAAYASGSYISRRYTILNAAGGIAGTFGGLVNTNLPANFSAALAVDATRAYLDVTLNFVPPPPGPTAPAYTPLNTNQSNVATALVNYFNRNGGIPLAFGALSPAGLTQVSGEIATGSQQTTFDAMNLFLGLLTDPFVAGRNAPSAGSAAFADEANAYAAKRRRSGAEREAYGLITKAVPPAPTFEQRWAVWAAGYGGSQTTGGNAALGANTASSRVYGGAAGADYWFSPQTVAGFALAGGGTQFSVADGGSGRSDLFQAGAFVRHTQGPAYITAALAYGWQDITTDRTVTAVGIDRLRAQFNANAYSGRIEGGYRVANPWLAITPYAAGQFTTFELPAYAETAVGANTFALAYAGKTVTASRSELGLRSDRSWALGDGVFTLRGRAAWAHDFNTDRNVQATFQTLPGASFVVNGAPRAGDAALATGSAEWTFASGLALAATFEGEFSDVTRSYAGKGIVRYAW